jgi:hypothetical protein
MNLRWTLHRRAAESIEVGSPVHGEFSRFGEGDLGYLSATISPGHCSKTALLYRPQRVGEESGDQERL